MRAIAQPLQVTLRHAVPGDAATWELLRCAHWPDGAADHGPEIAAFFAGTLPEPQAVLMAILPCGQTAGFTELSIRTDLPGHEGHRVGYIEGLYIRPEVRGRGLARKLLIGARNWARSQRCALFASDRAGRVILYKRF